VFSRGLEEKRNIIILIIKEKWIVVGCCEKEEKEKFKMFWLLFEKRIKRVTRLLSSEGGKRSIFDLTSTSESFSLYIVY